MPYGIKFQAPDTGDVAAEQMAEAEWPVIWGDPDDASDIEDYVDGGPGCPDWDTSEYSVSYFTQKPELMWIDENGQKWLSRHLIPDGAEALSAEALALAQRHVWTVAAADCASRMVSNLEPAKLEPDGPFADVIAEATKVRDRLFEACRQFEAAWAVQLEAEHAAGRGVAPVNEED